jgi:hypothetical protein
MFALVIVKGPDAGKRFPLGVDPVLLGRSPDVEVVLNGTSVSRQHARIWQRGGSFFIEDYRSSNGTILNGRRLTQPEPLEEGDEIQIGDYTLAFRREESALRDQALALPEDFVIRARVPIDPDAADFQGPAAGQQLQAVLRVGQRLARTLDLDDLLGKLLANLMPLFPTAERGSVVLRRGDELVARAQCTSSPWGTGTYAPNEATVRLAMREGIGVLASPATAAELGADEAVGALLCAPLIGQEGLRLGAIVLETRGEAGEFRGQDLRLLTAIALQGAVFVENATRHAELVGGSDEPRPTPSPSNPAFSFLRRCWDMARKLTRPTPSPSNPAFSSHTVVTRYPAPIALAYRRFCRQREPAARLKALFAALEAALCYLAILGVCDLFRRLAMAGVPGARLPDHPAFDFLRRPRPMTLGAWIEALRETARALAAGPPGFVPELAAACAPDGRLVGQDLARLVQLRNAHAHEAGGLVATPEECQQTLREARPLLDEVLQQVRFVCDYPLGFAQRSRGGAGTPTRHRYYLHSCMGARVANTVEACAVESPVPLQEHFPFVVARDGSRLLYFWPLLLERVATHTERHTLYVFEGLPDRRGSFLTRVRLAAIEVRDGWTQVLREQPAADHGWLLERLRELPAALDVPPGLRLAERLAPLSGGKLIGQSLGPNRLLAVLAVGASARSTPRRKPPRAGGSRSRLWSPLRPSATWLGSGRSSSDSARPANTPTSSAALTGATRSSGTGSIPGFRWNSRPAGTWQGGSRSGAASARTSCPGPTRGSERK